MLTLKNNTVDLFSGAVSGTGSLNDPHDFTNPLPEPVNLSNCEVTVKEFSLPTSWHPVRAHVDPHQFRWLVIKRWRVGAYRVTRKPPLFSLYQNMRLDDHCKWVGEEGRVLLFTLKEGHYDTGRDIVNQVIKQTMAVFPRSPKRPTLRIVEDKTGFGHLFDSVSSVTILVNETLVATLGFAERDVSGVEYPWYTLIAFKTSSAQLSRRFNVILAPDSVNERRALLRAMGISNDHNPQATWKEMLTWTVPGGGFTNLAGTDRFRAITNRLNNAINLIPVNDGFHLEHLKPLRHQDPKDQIQRFHIYADFVQAQVVGNEKKRLLLTLTNPGVQKQSPVYHVEPVHLPYVSTLDGIVKRLRVWIEDEDGNPVTFTSGTVRLQLHFRQRQPVPYKEGSGV